MIKQIFITENFQTGLTCCHANLTHYLDVTNVLPTLFPAQEVFDFIRETEFPQRNSRTVSMILTSMTLHHRRSFLQRTLQRA